MQNKGEKNGFCETGNNQSTNTELKNRRFLRPKSDSNHTHSIIIHEDKENQGERKRKQSVRVGCEMGNNQRTISNTKKTKNKNNE